MGIVRKLAKAGALLLLAIVGSSGCDGDDTESRSAGQPTREELEAVWEEAQPIIDDELTKENLRSAGSYPCTVLDQSVADNLLSTETEAPAFTHDLKSSHDIDTGESRTWQAEACTWGSRGGGASLNIWVSKPSHFVGGRVTCEGINDGDVTEPMFGGNAKWEFLASFKWAKLLVCTERGLFFVEINDGPETESEAKRISMDIAGRVAQSL